MRKKDLAKLIDRAGRFNKPKLRLEQYVTPGEIVATMVWDAFVRGEVVGRKAVDLGCGTGRFSLALALLGGYSICLDVDPDAVRDAMRFANHVNVDYVVCDALRPCVREVDLVVMNPPFGIWCTQSDVDFLKSASSLSRLIYSIHKASAGDFARKFAERIGLKAYELERAEFHIPLQYRHHRRRLYKVAVALFRFESTGVARKNVRDSAAEGHADSAPTA